MSLESTLLRLCSTREGYNQIIKDVPKSGLDEAAYQILKGMSGYYALHPKADRIDPEYFVPYLEERYKSFPEARIELLKGMASKVASGVPNELREGITGRLMTTSFVNEALDKIKKWNDGDEVDILTDLKVLAEDTESRLRRDTAVHQEESAEDLFLEDLNDDGLPWRLSCLRDNLRPLRGGDFLIAAGSSDAGKTSFLCNQVVSWMQGADDFWPGQERNALFLVNEGSSKKVRKRFIQSVLRMTTLEVIGLVEQAKASGKPLLREACQEALGLALDRIKFIDIHSMNTYQVEKIIRNNKAGVVVIDMIDHIDYAGGTVNNGERTDQILEALYLWARDCAGKYDAVVVGSSQLSELGTGNRWPGQNMLKDSRIGKAASTELIITIGKDLDPQFVNSRFINTPKNKYVRPGGRQEIRAEVIFDAPRATFKDPI